jgi:hypothetical protein
MFLPVEIGRNIVDFAYVDSSGAEHRLVKSVEIINASKKRPPVLNEPLLRWPGDLLLGLAPAALAEGIRRLRKTKPLGGRVLWGIYHSILGLVLGAGGCVLVFAWFFMKNDYIQQNINLLFINPLALAAVPLGMLSATGGAKKLRPERSLQLFWTCVAVAGILTQLLRILSVFPQQNQSVAAIILPTAVLLSCIAEDRYQFLFQPSKKESS